ncbi:MAG: hypothetical protein LBR33_06940 [Propionibacteriaceae bacterium]|jgi:membrane protein YqaA with SNARE-associated domain|nr:hypothetical protein [Propionibacteriaceae bacterium]
MWQLLGVIASAVGTGFLSAVFPVVNAEAAIAIGAGVASLSRGVAWIIGLSAGQTIGKIVIYESARAGKDLHSRRRAAKQAAVEATEAQLVEAALPGSAAVTPTAAPSRWRRFRAWLARTSQRLLALMDGRWRGDAVLLLSASVGIPPLLATAALAGVLKLRRLDFVVCVLAGRLARFFVIGAPFLTVIHR